MAKAKKQPMVHSDGDSPPIDWARIDPGIRDVVAYLRERGFDTFQSCEGGKGHAWSRPSVSVVPRGKESFEEVRTRVVRSLLARGYRDFSTDISIYHGFTDRRSSGGWPTQVMVEFWADRKPIRPFRGRKSSRSLTPPRKRAAPPTAAELKRLTTVFRRLAKLRDLPETWVQRALAEHTEGRNER